MPNIATSDQPLVSVIIPTYNRTQYFKEALESAVEQTFSDIEIIVTDNCSDEENYRKIAGIVESASESRVRIRRNQKNIGQLQNFLTAVRESRGKYVASLHDDDVWRRNFLAELVPPLEEREDLSLAFSDHYLIDANSNIKLEDTQRNTEQWGREDLAPGVHKPFCQIALAKMSVPVAMASVIRKSAVDWKDVSEESGHAYDLWLAYLACRGGMGAYYHPGRLTSYRVHEDSATAQSMLALHEDLAFCYDQFLKDERLVPLHEALRKQCASYYVSSGAICLRLGEQQRAREHFKKALRICPNIQAFGGLLLGFVPNPVAVEILSIRRFFLELKEENATMPEVTERSPETATTRRAKFSSEPGRTQQVLSPDE